MWKRLCTAVQTHIGGLGWNKPGGDGQSSAAPESYNQDATQVVTARTEAWEGSEICQAMAISELESIIRDILKLRVAMEQRQDRQDHSNDLRRTAMNNNKLRRLMKHVVAKNLYTGAADLIIELLETTLVGDIPTLGRLILMIETKLGSGMTAATFDTARQSTASARASRK